MTVAQWAHTVHQRAIWTNKTVKLKPLPIEFWRDQKLLSSYHAFFAPAKILLEGFLI